MKARWLALLAMVASLAGGLAYGLRRGDHAPAGTRALWGWIGEAQHEVSRVPSAAVRVPTDEEIRIGNDMARGIASARMTRPADIAMARTVTRVGERLSAKARRTLPYQFHYLPYDGYFNAFALPGGHVAIGKGLVAALSTEDELAAILGHEVAHVDRYHCADVIQMESARRGVPFGGLLTLPMDLFRAGYSKDQETEADRAGTALAVEAGYSPLGAVHAMQMLAARMPRRESRSGNPLEESARAGLGGLGEYFKSHPDPGTRLRVIEELVRTQGWVPAPERPLPVDVQNSSWPARQEPGRPR